MSERKYTFVDIGFLKFKFRLEPVSTVKCTKAVDEWLTKCEKLVKKELEKMYKGGD